MRLIDKQVAIKIAEKYGLNNGTTLGRHTGIADLIAEELGNLPTIETEPVVHGWWILKDDHGSGVCSNCHRQDKIDPLAGFCRYCGARMDGGVNDDIPKGN